ncbi:Vacuolar protein sorting-associated protein 18 like protein [Desmophyllum pertusum]|uniref:Vacuolar protein sorting-associated protein 18 like protein n=1 Tax=Desmophyllum pertusum TaxID=174260 RepID=A0A9X0CKZ7_9CNID|nr:Vacuolar protein sorting-associated protein 18 like protein [Desmophyllum pertusum]
MFLLKKLDSLKNQDKTQTTMLIMWLIELYLNDLGSLKEEGSQAKHEDLEEEFRKFLAQTKVKVGDNKESDLMNTIIWNIWLINE